MIICWGGGGRRHCFVLMHVWYNNSETAIRHPFVLHFLIFLHINDSNEDTIRSMLRRHLQKNWDDLWMRQLPTKGVQQQSELHSTHAHTLSQHFHYTPYTESFKRTVYGSTWMEKQFYSSLFQFSAVHLCETVSFIVLHSHTHVRWHTHTHTYTPNSYLNTTCAVNVLGDQHKLNLCLWSVFFLMLAKL